MKINDMNIPDNIFHGGDVVGEYKSAPINDDLIERTCRIIQQIDNNRESV